MTKIFCHNYVGKLLVALLLLINIACSDDSRQSGRDKASIAAGDIQINAHYPLPEQIVQTGKLSVAVVPQFKPMAFYPEGTGELSGADPEIMLAIADRLGLAIEWFPVSFDAMLAGVASGRFDAAITGISDTPARREHMMFVDYMVETKIFLTLASNPASISGDLDSACAHTIAVQRGTVDPEYIQIVNRVCREKGLAEARSLEFTSSSDKKLAVQSGRVDASFFSSIDFPALQEESGGSFAAFVLHELPEELWGIALGKGDELLARTLLKVTQDLIDDGTYMKILEKWDIEKLAISSAAINAGK